MTVPVSIVIPVHNRSELLQQLLKSIESQTVAPLEVIVVDDASTEDTAAVAGVCGARIVAMERNSGFAASVNRGIVEARGEIIALLNSDVTLERDWLEILWSAMDAASADFATGTILQPGGLVDGTYDLVCRGGTAWRAGAGHPLRAFNGKIREIRFCSATAALYRKSLFSEVGRFDELFESYLEDVEFGMRCAVRGKRGIYCPTAVCQHLGSSSFGTWTARVVRLIARNQVLLLARHYPPGILRRWMWRILVAQLLWGALAVRHGRGISWIRGKLEGVRRFQINRSTSPIEDLVVESEREIYRLQAAGGFDTYWRIYFALTGRPR